MKGKQMSKDRTVRIGDKIDGKREYGEQILIEVADIKLKKLIRSINVSSLVINLIEKQDASPFQPYHLSTAAKIELKRGSQSSPLVSFKVEQKPVFEELIFIVASKNDKILCAKGGKEMIGSGFWDLALLPERNKPGAVKEKQLIREL